jgi:hypothetical protein
MQLSVNSLKCLSAIALLALAVGCASTQSKENMLVAAGFKVITPKTAEQTAKMKALPSSKVTQVKKDGKLYYVFPDVAHNQVYVGGPQQYQAYQQLKLDKQIADENMDAAEIDRDTSMNWGAWGGWDGGNWGMWY